MAKAAIRRECRKFYGYDWDSFLADAPAWEIPDQGIPAWVHRKALRECAARGLDCRPADLPTDTVLHAVRSVIEEWTANPELRPSAEGFDEEQDRRGEKGRETTRVKNQPRNARIMDLVSQGLSDAEIGRREGLHRSQVGRIRKENATPAPAEPLAMADATPEPAAAAPLPPFPAPEVPTSERWPARQFAAQTGAPLDPATARELADMGRCAEAEGPESVNELMAMIRITAERASWDPWAYLQRAWRNRGDAWIIPAQLLADALTWCGDQALDYALRAVAGGYVERPVAYLQTMVTNGKRAGPMLFSRSQRPLHSAVRMAQRLAPSLDIPDADAAIAAEAAAIDAARLEDVRRVMEENRRRWPDLFAVEPVPAGPAPVDGEKCCIGLTGSGDDSSVDIYSESGIPESSGFRKADATPEPELLAGPTSPLKRGGNETGAGASIATGTGGNEGETTGTTAELEPARSTSAVARPCTLPRRSMSRSVSPRVSRPAPSSATSKPAVPVPEKPLPVAVAVPPSPGTLTAPVSTSPPEPPRNCPSKLAPMLAACLPLGEAQISDCAVDGCGCRHYTAGGISNPCPCHLAPRHAAQLMSALLRTNPPDWS